MAALSTLAPRPVTQNRMETGENPEMRVYSIASTQVAFHLGLIAFYDGSVVARPKGTVGPWSNSADEIFLGQCRQDTRTGVADLSVKTQVTVDGGVLDFVTIANSNLSRPGTPVYCSTDNVDDLTIVPPTASSKPVGELYIKAIDDLIGTDWTIILKRSQALSNLDNAQGDDGPLATLITATIVLAAGVAAASPGNYHRITAAAPAAITLPIPTAAELGRVAYFARIGGAALPTISFTDEGGGAVARALADGEVLKVKATSVTGWRILS
jgi:hypothetical protein